MRLMYDKCVAGARLFLVVGTLCACETRTATPAGAGARQQGGVSAFDPASWQPPALSELAADSFGASVRRGLALLTYTNDSLPQYAPGNITCTSCHLNTGRNAEAMPLTGAHARYPKFLQRTGAVVGLADRVNYCFTRSLAGNRLPTDSREMQDILTYLAWMSRGIPVGEGHRIAGGEGLAALPEELRGDRARGKETYSAQCASCHLESGEGNRSISPAIPALWGQGSYAVGASMARPSRAAAFIWRNMPWGMGRTLTLQEAYDVAAYISSQPRPDSPGKENDWPLGGAPADVPYATKGRSAHEPPPLLRRANPERAIVAAPPSVRRSPR